jgi:hypothetical protein
MTFPAVAAFGLSRTSRDFCFAPGFVNARSRWTGHLFQGRFSSVALDEAHLMAAARYVALIPVRARAAGRAGAGLGLVEHACASCRTRPRPGAGLAAARSGRPLRRPDRRRARLLSFHGPARRRRHRPLNSRRFIASPCTTSDFQLAINTRKGVARNAAMCAAEYSTLHVGWGVNRRHRASDPL